MRIRECIIVWFKTALFGSLIATLISIPIIFIKMENYLMPTISIIIPFIVLTILASLITSIPTIAIIIIFRESLLRSKTKSNLITKKINLIHWFSSIMTFIIIAFAFEFSKLALIFLSVFLISFLSIGHFLWQKELKNTI